MHQPTPELGLPETSLPDTQIPADIRQMMVFFRRYAESCLNLANAIRTTINEEDSKLTLARTRIRADRLQQIAKGRLEKIKKNPGEGIQRTLLEAYAHTLANRANSLSLYCAFAQEGNLNETERQQIEVWCTNLEEECESLLILFQKDIPIDKQSDHFGSEKLSKIRSLESARISIENPHGKELQTFGSILHIIIDEIALNVSKYGENLSVMINFWERGVDFVFSNNIKQPSDTVFSSNTGTKIITRSIEILHGTLHQMGVSGGLFRTHFTLPYSQERR